MEILGKEAKLSVEKALRVAKPSLIPLLETIGANDSDIQQI